MIDLRTTQAVAVSLFALAKTINADLAKAISLFEEGKHEEALSEAAATLSGIMRLSQDKRFLLSLNYLFGRDNEATEFNSSTPIQ